MPFPYKTVLITGATSGIGLALAERMIAADIFVIAVGRRKDRLEALVEKHGAEKVAVEPFDVSDLDAMPAWVQRITSTYPRLDSIVLNAGFQRSLDFTSPASISLASVSAEVTTNYLSPLHMLSLFLPHLISLAPSHTSIVLVSSGLAVLPLPRCANYSATKAAIHSLAWSLRCQLSGPDSPHTQHIKVIEIMPPAVRTELHPQQKDLVEAGQDQPGIELERYIEETWASLIGEEEKEEIVHSVLRERLEAVEGPRKTAWQGFVSAMRRAGLRF
ncbi:putative dehydrogenase [Triangularia verruculosa]|uniref:Dehydrogenase n=1 Tax=Triangularia verruculosa TaxID=2587418 RepID=A0AAN6XKM8_9PEZI|nr:putative dehydrogenase [Triangularia verruculosa]